MIPRIAERGYSFKGAGQYYLHDKGDDTQERVAWTYTHNLPTDDPELAMKWMAHTAISSNKIKQQADVPLTGRKSVNKPVYSFSLAWQPEQAPQDEHMKDLALDALNVLGLSEHEAVFVAHNDTAHPHVHVITNLVNPNNGKTLRPQNDRLKFSSWAENYEREHGKIYCEERVINNERRRNGEKVKHRETQIDQSLIIQNLYKQAQDSRTFQSALVNNGFTLAKGDRRGFVLVDQTGKISSLSRQLKGQRAKDIRDRLGDLEDLPNAKQLSEDRKFFMRDEYEAERQKKIVDAAIKLEKEKKQVNNIARIRTEKSKEKDVQRDEVIKNQPNTSPIKSFAEEMDAVRKKEESKNKEQARKDHETHAFYKRDEFVKKMLSKEREYLRAKSQKDKDFIKKELVNLENTLSTIDQRMKERGVDITPKDEGRHDQPPSPDSARKDFDQANTPLQNETGKNAELRAKTRDELRNALKNEHQKGRGKSH